MSERRPISAEHYVRRVAAAWERVTGRAVILSEREWRLLCDWHARGVPLEVLEDAMRAAVERRRGAPRSLVWLAPAVEDAWAAVRDGRTDDDAGAPVAPGEPAPPDEDWRARQAASAGTPLGDLLGRLLGGLADGSLTSDAADDRLDEALPAAAPEETLRRATAEVDRRLAGFRGRLDAEALARSRTRAIVAALRRALRLPRRTGFRPPREPR